MRILKARNVNGLFYDGMHLLDEFGVEENSRAGHVKVAPWPVMSVYVEPCERVLFDEKRDANPFFHCLEFCWMIAGRRDAAFLNRYVANFGERFAERDGTIHDAYGHRWRSALGYDQLDAIVGKLRSDPASRQCVLQMWDATQDDNIGFRGDDLCGDWRGRPCNTHVYFRVTETRKVRGGELCVDKSLDMTICCRSNDIVWGAYGANAVHFSMLLEYMAGRAGLTVGTMYQLSNNWHGYVSELEKLGDVTQLGGHDPYDDAEVRAVPIGSDWERWDDDLSKFMRWHDGESAAGLDADDLEDVANLWFRNVAALVAQARWEWTHGMKSSAVRTAERIAAPDWRRACVEWMERRRR